MSILIHYLSHYQIQVAEEISESAVKEYTAMVAEIIKRMWNGAMGLEDVMIVNKD